MTPTRTRIPITSDADVVTARAEGRALASSLEFSSTDLTLIATAISEVARNIVTYAHEGEIELSVLDDGGRRGLEVIASDRGPGIPDIQLALTDSYSTGKGLGLGLPGSRRIMDEFDIASQTGVGTTVTMRKWERRRA